jgi:hypothetical protein
MRYLQARATACNARIITRSWSRGKRFESARRLSSLSIHGGPEGHWVNGIFSKERPLSSSTSGLPELLGSTCHEMR